MLPDPVARSRKINRNGRRCTATVPASDAGWEPYSLLGRRSRTVDRGILTCTLTIGAGDLPVRWKPVRTEIMPSAGRYEPTFTTRCRNRRTAPAIIVPR